MKVDLVLLGVLSLALLTSGEAGDVDPASVQDGGMDFGKEIVDGNSFRKPRATMQCHGTAGALDYDLFTRSSKHTVHNINQALSATRKAIGCDYAADILCDLTATYGVAKFTYRTNTTIPPASKPCEQIEHYCKEQANFMLLGISRQRCSLHCLSRHCDVGSCFVRGLHGQNLNELLQRVWNAMHIQLETTNLCPENAFSVKIPHSPLESCDCGRQSDFGSVADIQSSICQTLTDYASNFVRGLTRAVDELHSS